MSLQKILNFGQICVTLLPIRFMFLLQNWEQHKSIVARSGSCELISPQFQWRIQENILGARKCTTRAASVMDNFGSKLARASKVNKRDSKKPGGTRYCTVYVHNEQRFFGIATPLSISLSLQLSLFLSQIPPFISFNWSHTCVRVC